MAKKSSGKGIGLDAAMPMHMSAKQMKDEKRYQAEDDLRTLRRADEIRADRARMATAKSVAADEIKALTRVAK